MRCATLVVVAGLAVGCGGMQRAGSPETAPRRGSAAPRLFDASSVYRSMGALVGGGALPFIASVRYLAGPTPDSTLALFSVSLTNQTLTFPAGSTNWLAVNVPTNLDNTSEGIESFTFTITSAGVPNSPVTTQANISANNT